jgi:phytoene dehydrogenase-like protein
VTLQRAGLDVALLEASDAPGGRVRTDRFEGFLLDRGFQVLLTAYPEAQSTFDYPTLDLRPLKPGALVWKGGRFHRFADPFRDPLAALRLALDPIVTMGDKLGVARLRAKVSGGPVSKLFSENETTTRNYLGNFGFSAKIIGTFFEPFFGGVFLEKDLTTSSRYFEFLFRMFSTGAVSIPAAGMQSLPDQLAARLRPGTLRTGYRATNIQRDGQGFSVRTTHTLLNGSPNGEVSAAKRVVLAVAEFDGARLLQDLDGQNPHPPRRWNRTTTFYFATEQAPLGEAILVLNGEGEAAGPVNNAVVMSAVSRSYASSGAHLISASVIGQAPADGPELTLLADRVRQHLKLWFGAEVAHWRFLKAYPIEHALPLQQTAVWESRNPRLSLEGGYSAGDYTETASIQGALASGRSAAEAILNDRGERTDSEGRSL